VTVLTEIFETNKAADEAQSKESATLVSLSELRLDDYDQQDQQDAASNKQTG
jgi:hypothetical protein